MLTKIVDWIIGQKVISPTQRELYEYAVQCFFVTAIPFVISVLLSILLHMLAASTQVLAGIQQMREKR